MPDTIDENGNYRVPGWLIKKIDETHTAVTVLKVNVKEREKQADEIRVALKDLPCKKQGLMLERHNLQIESNTEDIVGVKRDLKNRPCQQHENMIIKLKTQMALIAAGVAFAVTATITFFKSLIMR